jgi:Lactate dehydrogenase and related dehydrogenases
LFFVETEDDEQPFFAEGLADHDVVFVEDITGVPRDAEIVSVFIHSRVGAEFFRRHPKVKLVASRSSASDHLDLKAAARRGVILARVPDYGAATVAEHTFALILGVTRRLRQCLETRNRGRGAIARLRGLELRGKTLGVVGTGRVGRMVLAIGKAFGMDCLAFDRKTEAELAGTIGFRYVSLDKLLRCSDVVTLHVPLNPRTRHLLSAKRLARGKPGFILINTARGALVDIDALLTGLKSGQVGGVGLDVLEDDTVFRQDASRIIGAQIVQKIHAISTPGGDPLRREKRLRELEGIMRNRQLLAHQNVFFTPHVGFNSIEAIERINLGTVQNIRDFLAGRLRPAAVVAL